MKTAGDYTNDAIKGRCPHYEKTRKADCAVCLDLLFADAIAAAKAEKSRRPPTRGGG